ncbi:MAG: phage major capsid protein [Ignavibacteria bacterium]|nr:phage major capsid protein [Ignavibacteria bacterium]
MNYKTFNSENRSFDDDKMIIEHYITTSVPDRYGEVVNPAGMDAANYRKNPVVLFCHDSKSMVIGKNLSLTPDEKGIKAVTQFADTEAGREIYRLNREGFLNAWSIGFIPKSKPELKKIDGNEVYFIGDWELLEYSSVPVPANPDSVNIKLKQLFNSQENIKTLKSGRKNSMEENQNTNNTAADEQKMETISRKVAAEVIKDELLKSANLFSGQIPAEGFRDKVNRESRSVQDGRNFLKSIVYSKPELMPAEYRDYLNETEGSAGGYLVPQEWHNRIMLLVSQGGVAMRNATVYNMTRRELVIPKLDSIPTWSFVNEGTVKPVSNPSYAQVILRRKDGGFIVLFSKQLLEDEAFDVMGFVTNLAAQILSLTIDTAAFKGIAGNISGLLTNGIGASVVETAGADFSSLTYDDLINAVASVPSHTLPKAKWYMHRMIYGLIKQLRYGAGSEYVLSPQDRKELLLEGYPVELTDACYSSIDSQADRAFIGFGDLAYMALGMRNSLTIDFSKEATVVVGGQNVNLWQSGLVGLNFSASFDIKFTFPSALAVIKSAA